MGWRLGPRAKITMASGLVGLCGGNEQGGEGDEERWGTGGKKERGEELMD